MLAVNQAKIHHSSSLVELFFSNGFSEMISLEMLRVNSPAVKNVDKLPLLVTDKAFVKLETLEQASDQGVRLQFNDGHDSGYFSWDDLYQLAKNQDKLWVSYLNRLKIAKMLRVNPLDITVSYC
ncbi:MAG: DUF971 domain-containing protein [Gammaproteobacteria bacterium]|nr:DUF971 domain-containing protein [Gammaproteobacteria bacterium]